MYLFFADFLRCWESFVGTSMVFKAWMSGVAGGVASGFGDFGIMNRLKTDFGE